MKKQGTIPLEKPLLLYTDQGPLCAIVLDMDHQVLQVGVLLQQGWVPREWQLPIAGVFLEINRQAVQGPPSKKRAGMRSGTWPRPSIAASAGARPSAPPNGRGEAGFSCRPRLSLARFGLLEPFF